MYEYFVSYIFNEEYYNKVIKIGDRISSSKDLDNFKKKLETKSDIERITILSLYILNYKEKK